MSETIHAPGAVAPEREWTLRSHGVRLHLSEWGDPAAPPLLCCHGMFDHGRGFDLLAPLLAARFRVIALDARGHGNSGWADSYLWPHDVHDIANVALTLGRPVHLLGHSKSGGQVMEASILLGDRARQVVNIDGFGPPDDEGFGPPDRPDRSHMSLPERCAEYLDRRRESASRVAWRPYPSLDDLVQRRGQQNPRLQGEWLRYFVYHAAFESEDGWRWKSDPQTVAGGFGPFRVDWIGRGWRAVRAPVLAIIGSVADSWGPLPEAVLAPRLANVSALTRATVEGAGHFVHMERPRELSDLLLGWLDA